MNPIDFNNLMTLFASMTPDQKQQALSALSLNTAPDTTLMFKSPSCCPHCASISFVHNGHKDGRQRYLCKDCRRTFGDTNNTPLYHSRLSVPALTDLIKKTLYNLSIRKISKEVSLNRNTVWLFKHKLCATVKALSGEQDSFNAIAEADEYYTTLSFKGKRDLGFFLNTLGRMPRHHYTFAEKLAYLRRNGFDPDDYQEQLANDRRKKGISNEQVCVFTCVDRSENTLVNPACLGRITSRHIKSILDGKLSADAVLVTDEHRSYKDYAYLNNVHLEQVRSDKHARGAFNLARVNAYHSRLSAFSPPVKQGASKYLDAHMALFRYTDKARTGKVSLCVNELVDAFAERVGYNGLTNFRAKPLPFDTKGLIVC